MPRILGSATRREGHVLATRHVLGPSRLRAGTIRRRVRFLDRAFAELFRDLREAPSETEPSPLSPSAREWLGDNDYVVAEAVEALDGALPSRFVDRLPGLREPREAEGRTRVEALARELVNRDEGRVELDEIRAFLEGYQEVRPLRLAELWALPSFVRLALLDALLVAASRGGEQVEVAPYILSLRTLAGEDWREVVEALSRVEEALGKDPAGVHPRMDFRTRDRYRREVEEIAYRVGSEEDAVARRALELARARAAEPREGHVGFYLVDEGREALFRELGSPLPPAGTPRRRRWWAGGLYFGGIAALSFGFLLLVGFLVPGWARLPALVLGLIPALGTAVSVANWVSGRVVAARTLPRLDVREGIPRSFRTVVAVPALLGSRDDIRELLHTMETNHRANPDPALTYALVTDHPDADEERTERDELLLAEAARGIRGLNERYGGGVGKPFVLLHRPRRWNPRENRWMGWERKRGKLTELNELLLGRPSGLWVVEGDPDRLQGIPFVLTVDADTLLPRDAAARLVGTLAHPLNRPEVGPRGRIRRGYSVLQPRIEVLPEADGGTLFSRILGGVQGLDLYAHAAFDVYQDLFDVGIFAGKGIYDVRAFEASLVDRVPENTLLSHDLFEGACGRAGLVSDLVVLEDFPGHPLAYNRRAHRWIRGDWQLLPWLFPRVPAEGGVRRRNPFSALSRWMILDNLRRSVQPPAVVALLLLGWAAVPAGAPGLTALLLGVVGIPFFTGTLDAAARAIRDRPRRGDLEAEGRAFLRALVRWFLDLAFLADTAWTSADATVRTVVRVYVTRRRLLEWTSAAVTARAVRRSDSLRFVVRNMRAGPLTAGGAAAGLVVLPAPVPLIAIPLLGAWVLSPVLAHAVSRAHRRVREPLGEFLEADARLLARRTWGYYERFQSPEGHWLPPDHFQEEPGGEIAYRTSPTNLAMALASAATAWDLGFIGSPRLVTQIRNTVDAMGRLHRYRGHFLNWYGTVTLEPLHPLYVSTVDSGNLAAALLVTRETLRDARRGPLVSSLRARGILDTLLVVRALLEEASDDGGAQALLVEVRGLEGWARRTLLPAWDRGLRAYLEALEELGGRRIPELESRLLGIRPAPAPGTGASVWAGIRAWIGHLRVDVDQALEEVVLLLPWLGPDHRDRPEARSLHEELVPDARIPSLRDLADGLAARTAEGGDGGPGNALPPGLARSMARALRTVRLLLDDLDRLDRTLDRWYQEMDFSFLYDARRELFRIGFSVTAGELDPNHYDLLASEARIASAVALSKGEAPPTHWLHLARPYGRTRGGPVLLSWAGTMFEYLMPTLFLRNPPGSVLAEACRRAVEVQRRYARQQNVPWGISESGYHVLSPEGDYQYRAFGVPILGLRRDAGDRLVVSPYASFLATPLFPGAVRRNLDRLVELGGMGPWGLYEALDFGPESRREGQPRVVRSYMSHHQGMILTALGNHLTGNRLVERFHRDPRVATVEPYLHERPPWRRGVERRWVDRTRPAGTTRTGPGIRSWSPPVDRLPPPVHHLVGGDLVVTLGPDGRGGSRWNGWSVIRGSVGTGWPAGGPDLVLLDRGTGESWSALPDPGAPGDGDQQITFEAHRAEFHREFKGIRTRMDVLLPPLGGVELRRLVLSNDGVRPRHLRLAVAAELALAPWHDDLRHPAFHKLFVRAEALPEGEGLLFERRRRSPDEEPPVVLVTLLGPDGEPPRLRWGTSRDAFLGRLGLRDRPAALDEPKLLTSPREPHHPLDPMVAAVLDVDLEAWEDVSMTLILAVGPDRDSAIRAASEYRLPRRQEWARIQARARAEGELLRLKAKSEEPILWEELLSHVLHPRATNRLYAGPDAQVDLRQSSLWRWGISGDLPLIVVEGVGEEGLGLVGGLIRAQRWWRARGREVDLVLVGRAPGGYQDPIRDRIGNLLQENGAEDRLGRPGGVHLVRGDDVDDEARFRLGALAAFRLDASRGSLAAQVAAARPSSARLPSRLEVPGARGEGEPEPVPPAGRGRGGVRAAGDATAPSRIPGEDELIAPSALGGFLPGTGEYLIRLEPGRPTPAPWGNVIASGSMGFLVTEAGGSFTWWGDAGEFRLTPWHNDPVLGLRGEVLYLRDEETAGVWTPAPGPLGLERSHRIRHGWGRTVLTARSSGLEEEVTWFLHPEVPVKVVRVRLRNRGRRLRRLSAVLFVDWVLGTEPAVTSGRLQIRFDSRTGAVLARNPYSLEFHDRIAFLAADGEPAGMATDRFEFLGPDGPLDRVPVGLRRIRTGERISPAGAGCGVIQREVRVGPGEDAEVSFYLGGAGSREGVERTLARLRGSPVPAAPGDLSEVSRERWAGRLERIRIRTPEPALDALMNGWLPYQTLASRLEGRTGFYQSGGAFGFRDQLQDVYTLLPLDPALAERHLAEAAARQFPEGDVLHWWHPGTTRGVRTRCSDDLLWLPYVLAHTVRWSGDPGLLDRMVPFVTGEPLADDEDERYEAFGVSDETAPLWDHALRAVGRAVSARSPRGLPLIGTGDWNDGMDRVGREGRGESVWLGWFVADICRLMAPLARMRGEDGVASRLEGWREELREAIEAHGWDGEWYRRAFFDDGTPLGSRDSREARIDSLAQSWAVISEAADPERARTAVDAAWRELVRPEEGVVLLLTPPFAGEGPDPGYIAAYPPGVRENGGQYTHAAAWLLRAVARLGDGARVGELLRLLLPPRHAEGPVGTARYRVEPYVIAADIYGAEPHVGRGGWTWYTGSAGWIWRVVLEDVLGIRREGGCLRLAPCIPPDWEGFEATVRFGNVRVEVRVRGPTGASRRVGRCTVNGEEADPDRIPLPGGDGGSGEPPAGEEGPVLQVEAVLEA